MGISQALEIRLASSENEKPAFVFEGHKIDVMFLSYFVFKCLYNRYLNNQITVMVSKA